MANGFGYFVQIFHPEKICGVKGGRITQYGHLSKFADDIKPLILPPIHKDLVKSFLRHNNRKLKHKLIGKALESKITKLKNIIKNYPWVEKFYGFNWEENKMESYLLTLDELETKYKAKDPFVTYVKQGDIIGYVGTSAIFYGDQSYSENQTTNINIQPFDNVWDEVHLHFEEAARNPKTRFKHSQRDPYDIYLSAKHYQNIGEKTLFD